MQRIEFAVRSLSEPGSLPADQQLTGLSFLMHLAKPYTSGSDHVPSLLRDLLCKGAKQSGLGGREEMAASEERLSA